MKPNNHEGLSLLGPVIQRYVAVKHALGRQFDSASYYLWKLDRFLGSCCVQDLTPETYFDYVHARTNASGPQKEWWCHRDGCGLWFTTWRNTQTNREEQKPK